MAPILEPQVRSCGPDCQYAAEVSGSFGEWYWCSRPDAARRLIRSQQECMVPHASNRPRPPPISTDEPRSLRPAM